MEYVNHILFSYKFVNFIFFFNFVLYYKRGAKMSSRKKGRKGKKRQKLFKTIFFLSLLFVSFGILFFVYEKEDSVIKNKKTTVTKYLASDTNMVEIFELKIQETEEEQIKILEKKEELPRGMEVKETGTKMQYQDKTYSSIQIEGKKYYVEESNLVTNQEKVVLETIIYTRSATSIFENTTDFKINGFASKGSTLEVIGYDQIDEEGNVEYYYIKQGEIEGYVYGKYMSFTEEEARQNYMSSTYDPIHSKIANTYSGGEAIKLDFYPNEKPTFTNNKMPDSVYALYLNCGSNTIKNIDAYIEFAKSTKINAFVIDIKDNESPAYPAKTFETLSPTNYSHAINSYEDYKNAITKLKEAGFYVIGRITTFKDSFYVQDHPEDAIIDKNTNQPYLHNGSYWPSAYSRNVWYYTISLAKEAVEEFGFNEINFDYVRFPDRMNSVSNQVDLKNTYQEDKTEAIQRFAQYATDVLHELEVYVSVDVFGETTNGTYTTAYGQYWPAISNVVDVISGMPYPDHFSRGYYGIDKPWNNPYKLMKYWGTYAMDRQKETTTPAIVRTWIQAYDVMKYVDPNGLTYGANEIEEEIRGLYDAGLRGGYITWLSNSNLEKYKTQAPAFQIDYGKEYQNE